MRTVWPYIGAGAAIGTSAFLLTIGTDVFPFLALGALALLVLRLPALRGQLGHAPVTAGTAPPKMEVGFGDIGGQDVAKEELREALDFVARREAVAHLGIRPLRGILLTGPPGTGKTLLAKAAATYTGSVFLAAAGSEFIEMYAGVGAQRVRDLFGRARQAARRAKARSAIIFIDEIDVLAPHRGRNQGHLEYDQTVNQLLVEMDGLRQDDDIQVLLLAATNRADLLDEAMLRPGRFDRVVKVDVPDRAGRLEILRIHTRAKPLSEDVDLDAVARETFGFTGAHLESVANEAAILALRQDRPEVCQADFEEAIDKVILGARSGRHPDEEERFRVAVHEVGHAMVAEWLEPGSVATITVSPRGAALGYVRRSPGRERLIETKDELLRDIKVALAGMLAEEICLGERSTGAAGDFDEAFATARRIVLGGMSPLGVVARDMLGDQELHEASRAILAEAESSVRRMVASRSDEVLRVARSVLEEERMDGNTLRGALGLGGAAGGTPDGLFDSLETGVAR